MLPHRNSLIVHYVFLLVAPDCVIDVHMGRDTVVPAPYCNASETFDQLLFLIHQAENTEDVHASVVRSLHQTIHAVQNRHDKLLIEILSVVTVVLSHVCPLGGGQTRL